MVHGDDNGLVLPPAVAPIQVIIVPVRQQAEGVLEKCQEIASALKAKGIRVKVDDSDRTPGWKFAQWEMKGVPLRIEVGPRDLEEGKAMLTKRVNGEKLSVNLETLIEEIPSILDQIHRDMFEKAKANLEASVVDVDNLEQLNAALEKGGYARMAFCGEEECELKIKDFTKGGTARAIYKEEVPEGTVCPVCGKPAKMVVYFAKAY